MTPQPSAASLRRDLALFLAYRFLSTSYLFIPVFLLFFAARGLTVTEITLLNTVYCATLIVFEVPTGVLADRWGRRRAMVAGSLLMATGALLDWAGHSFVVFAAGEGLMALGMTLSSGADSAYLFDLLRDAGREQDYRRLEGAASAVKLVGAALAVAAGGWLAERSIPATYFVTAVVCGLAAIAALALHERPLFRRKRALLAQIGTSARAVVTHPPLLHAVLFSTLVFVLLRMGIYLHQPYLTRAGLDLTQVGVVLAALSLVAALGAYRIEWLRDLLGERALILGLPLLLGLSYLALGRWIAIWGIALLALQGVINGVYSPLSKALLNREISDSSQRATILSVDSMARRLVFGGFAPLCGALIDAHAPGGLPFGFYACAGLALGGTLLLALRQLRRRRDAVPAAGAEEKFDHSTLPLGMPRVRT